MVTTRSSSTTAKGKSKIVDSDKPSSSSTRPRRNMNQPSSSSTNPETGLAVGLRFNPTDHEIVDHYLQNRISLGAEFHSDFVHECPDFYGQNEPWEVWHMYGGDDSKKIETLYLFTQRRRLSRNSTRFDRKVGSGTWSGLNPKPVVDEEDQSVVIGTKREFRYEGGCDEDHNDAWLMQEYQIDDDDCDIVVCTLRKSRRKPPPAAQTTSSSLNLKNKRKADVSQPKAAKRQKKEEISDEEQEQEHGSNTSLEPQGPSIEEHISFELDPNHPMMQESCYYPEFDPDVLVNDLPELDQHHPMMQHDFSNFDEFLATLQ